MKPNGKQKYTEMDRSSFSDDELIIFVLGGPGSGKGTQCKIIARKDDQFCHLSVGTMIGNCMKEAKLAPSDIVVELILRAMKQSGKKKFLIDEFPRNEENRVAFYSACQLRPKFVLYLSCSKEVMVQRLHDRQQGKEDDNPERIMKRVDFFEKTSVPVIEDYRSLGMLQEVNGEMSEEEVFKEITQVFALLKR
ncbi:hypothetical protein MKX01_011771 [Papaver californicum]|nr:hypothetical protein MKX01_011771 [Papaver californicum]